MSKESPRGHAPPRDSRGNPVTVGSVHLCGYPKFFEIVRVIALDPPLNSCTFRRVWPSGNSGEQLGTCMSDMLSPLDPSILGREWRELTGFLTEYARDLAPAQDTEEDIDHEDP